MLLTWLFRGLASRKTLVKSTCSSNTCSILHQLNTTLNTTKSHKIQGTKLKQLQHLLSWNKTNIKHSCKSQLYKYINRCAFIDKNIHKIRRKLLTDHSWDDVTGFGNHCCGWDEQKQKQGDYDNPNGRLNIHFGFKRDVSWNFHLMSLSIYIIWILRTVLFSLFND